MRTAWIKEVWRIINDQGTPSGRDATGARRVRDSLRFKPLPDRKLESVNNLVEDFQNSTARSVLGTYDSLKDVREKSGKIFSSTITAYKPNAARSIIQRVMKQVEEVRTKDAIPGSRDLAPSTNLDGYNDIGGVSNTRTQAGVYGQDSSLSTRIQANVWISPSEVASIYTQKGIYEMILRKKSQSILLNGVRIKCAGKHLSAKQLDTVNESMERTSVARSIADGTNMSLGYGGALLYPMFKKDNALTMGLPMETLARAGVIGKNCISRYVPLDRWNVVLTPSWDPTSEDYMNPVHYYIPFLGTDVHRERCARIVTGKQNGYWGNLMTLGWGISDIVGWYRSLTNLINVLETVPGMIEQMSVLIHEMNVDGLLSSEGSEILNMIAREDTARIRDASVNSIIDMDVIGSLKAIQRDFKEVPELVRLLRQQAAGDAWIPEELLWSSEKGAFASSDSNDSAFEKQGEGMRYIHLDVAHQNKHIAQLEVINALGLDRDVIKALPYIYFSFDNPRVTNAMDKAKIGGLINKGIFDGVAAGLPTPVAVEMGQQFADEEFHLTDEQMQDLKTRQAIKDQRETEKHEAEMQQMKAQAENGGNGVPGKPSSDKAGKGHSYKDPLEQKQHEKVGSGQKQGLAKAKNKAV